jgi:hypothetical protein
MQAANRVGKVLMEFFWLAAAGVIAGFSVDAEDIRAV